MAVIRIPIAGPAPYNTLVIVSETDHEDIPRAAHDGRMHGGTLTVATKFVLQGPPGQRVRPANVPHSTAVTLRALALGDDTAFTYALNAVSGRFDSSGRWWLDIATATLVDDEDGLARASYCSWVLCTEPSV
jgi:hypothetical protein